MTNNMPRKEPFAKGRRTCPFCGDASNSRSSSEHIWPRWAEPLLPKRQTKRELTFIGKNGFDEIVDIKKDYTRQGSPSGITKRGPCKKCNETWMSQIEEGVKPVLTKIIKGTTSYITRKDAKAVAEWAFLKFCVEACEDGQIWCVSDQQRAQFREERYIPKRFSAWLFRHDTQDWYDRARWFSSRVEHATFLPDMEGPHNVNTFTLGFGRALFLCVFQWGIRIDTGFSRKHVTKLWPLGASGGINLPEIELDEDEVNAVSRLLPLLVEDIG